MFTIHTDKKGLEFKNAEKRVMKVLDSEIQNVSRFVLAEVQKATPVGVTGHLRRAWFMIVRKYQVTISNPSVYLNSLELGRPAAPISREGRISLRLWVRRVMGVPEDQADHVTFLIARKKSKKPTPGQFFIKKTLNKIWPRIISYFASPAVVNRISAAYNGEDNGKGPARGIT